GEAVGAIQLDAMHVVGLGHHVPPAVPAEHVRIREMVGALEHDAVWTGLALLVDLRHGEMRARRRVELLLEEEVVASLVYRRERIGPDAIPRRHHLLEA